MSIFGVVCECNPYHSGHGKLIEKAVQLGADGLVAVMSGDFVQRGEPAVISKFSRAADLADRGFSLVFELPVRYSLSSSERFAAASVGLLDALGAVDTLFFGSESGDIAALKAAADAAEDGRVTDRTRELCSSGLSYPSALTSAVGEIFGEDVSSCMSSPNNILAIDYLRALKRLGSSMRPVTVKREEDGLSAHSARRMIREGSVADGMVSERTQLLASSGDISDPAKWDTVCMSALRRMSREEFALIPDVSGGLDSRLYRAAREAISLEELLQSVKTKSYTMSRVKRAVCCASLGIKGKAPAVPPYARLLAIGDGGAEILRAIRQTSSVPVSENLKELAAGSREAFLVAGEEMLATDIYNIASGIPRAAGMDMTARLYKKGN